MRAAVEAYKLYNNTKDAHVLPILLTVIKSRFYIPVHAVEAYKLYNNTKDTHVLPILLTVIKSRFYIPVHAYSTGDDRHPPTRFLTLTHSLTHSRAFA